MAENETTVGALYARYRRPLFGYVLRAVDGDFQHAEDIVQETMMRAWQKSSELEPDRAGRWLFVVARNLVISRHRRRESRAGEVPLGEREFEAVGDDINDVLQAWQVGEVLQELSQDHRRVIIELFYRGRTVSEVARLLMIPAGTVKSRSYYALHALRAALEERGVTGP